MDFFKNVFKLGKLISKPKSPSRNADPVLRNRENFINQVNRQLANVEAEKFDDKGSWIRKLNGGTYQACLRNGTATIPLENDNSHIEIASIELVKQFLEDALTACELGEFDQVLASTRRSRSVKPKEVA